MTTADEDSELAWLKDVFVQCGKCDIGQVPASSISDDEPEPPDEPPEDPPKEGPDLPVWGTPSGVGGGSWPPHYPPSGGGRLPPAPPIDKPPTRKERLINQVKIVHLEEHTKTRTVFLVKDGEMDKALKKDMIKNKSERCYGTIYFGVMSPPKPISNNTVKTIPQPDQVKVCSANAVWHIKHGEKDFMVVYGEGESLIDMQHIEEHFGVKVAFGLLQPGEQVPCRSSTGFGECINSTLTGNTPMKAWGCKAEKIKKNAILNSVEGSVRQEYTTLLAKDIKCGAGVRFNLHSNAIPTLEPVKLIMRLSNLMDDITMEDEKLIKEKAEIKFDEKRYNRTYPIPAIAEFYPYVLRYVVENEMGKETSIEHMHETIMQSFGLSFPVTKDKPENEHLPLFSQRVKDAMEKLVGYGLIKNFGDSATGLGKYIYSNHEVFSNELLNGLGEQNEKYRKSGDSLKKNPRYKPGEKIFIGKPRTSPGA